MSVYLEPALASSLQCQNLDTVSGNIIPLSINNSMDLCGALEKGGILYFPRSPISLSKDDHEFLLSQKQMESACHKNIAYRPTEDRLTGINPHMNLDTQRLHSILKWYSKQAGQFLQGFLRPYCGWKWDYASFRPIEEQGRKLRLRARNDLIHIDSFPTRPTYGGRILRFFTNIHPLKERVWQTSETFEWLAPRYAAKIPRPKSFEHQVSKTETPQWTVLLKKLGFRQSSQSPYDQWMMNLHNTLKEDTQFQTKCRKTQWAFPPGSAWIVMTDMVSHAVLSGQYALEQTFIVFPENMIYSEKAPIEILRRILR